MIKKSQNIYRIVLALIVATALMGYSRLDAEGLTPTTPLNSAQFANFWVGPGLSDKFGVYIGHEFFMLNVPKVGVYLLTYTIKSGDSFYIVTQVKQNSLLVVGLPSGNEVLHATIAEGQATNLAPTSPEIQDFGSVTVFYKTGKIGKWNDFIVINPTMEAIVLIQGGVVVISDTVVILTAQKCYTPSTPKKTKKTEKTKKTKKTKKK